MFLELIFLIRIYFLQSTSNNLGTLWILNNTNMYSRKQTMRSPGYYHYKYFLKVTHALGSMICSYMLPINQRVLNKPSNEHNKSFGYIYIHIHIYLYTYIYICIIYIYIYITLTYTYIRSHRSINI